MRGVHCAARNGGERRGAMGYSVLWGCRKFLLLSTEILVVFHKYGNALGQLVTGELRIGSLGIGDWEWDRGKGEGREGIGGGLSAPTRL